MSLMCKKCGAIFTKDMWQARKSVYGVYYICPDCGTKHHWNDLKKVERSDL